MGMGIGEGIYTGMLRTQSDSVPKDWNREPNTIPYKLSDLQGEEDLQGDEWSLDFYRGFYPQKRSSTLSLKARIPSSAQLEAWISAPPNKGFACRGNRCGNQVGLGVIIERIGEPSVSVVTRKFVRNRWKEEKRVCTLPTIDSQYVDLSLKYQNQTLQVQLNGSSCSLRTQLGSTPPLIRPGIRKIYIQEIHWDGPSPTPPNPFSRWLLWLCTGIASMALVWVDQKRKMHNAVGIAGALLLGFSWYLLGCNLKGWLESMRAAWIPWRWLPVIVPLGSTLLFRGTIESFRMIKERPWRFPSWAVFLLCAFLVQLAPPISSSIERVVAFLLVLGIPALLVLAMQFLLPTRDRRTHFLGIWGLAGILCILVTHPLHIWGVVWFYIAALCWSILIWANRNAQKMSGYNLTCLGISILMICAAEGMLRGSKAGIQWSNQGSKTEVNDIFGWISTANEDFALLEEGKHTKYPSRGYPVSFSPLQSKSRIVSFGGSTTGGAFQNDDIKQFYPAKLEALLPENWEVINQGVGGWTSWHIQEYIQKKHAQLKPDIVTLYIGHNDLLTFTPIPYAQLYKRWRSNPNAKSLSTTLGQFRLYHALRHFLVSLRPAAQKAAVPIDDAQKNIEEMITTFGSDTPIVLLSEGLAPDPSPLEGYNTMMESIAQQYDNVYYADVAQQLHTYPSTDIYLDDCHLTGTGHALVAQSIYDIIKQHQLLEAP